MNYAISILLDVIVIFAAAFPLIRGYRRGFKRCAFSLLSLAVSAVVAFVASELLAEPAYERFFRDNVRGICYSAAEKYDIVGQTEDILSEYGLEFSEDELKDALTSAESLPESVAELARESGASEESINELKEKVSHSLDSGVPQAMENMMPKGVRTMTELDLTDAQVYDAARACAESPDEAADFAERHYAAPICTAMIKFVLFFAAMGITALVMRLAFYIFGFDFSSRPDTFGDRLGGIAMGAVAAAANILLICVALSFVEQACDGFFEIETLHSKVFLPIFEALY